MSDICMYICIYIAVFIYMCVCVCVCVFYAFCGTLCAYSGVLDEATAADINECGRQRVLRVIFI